MKPNFFKTFISSVPVENMTQRVQWLVFYRWIAGTGVVISLLAGKAFFNIESVTVPLILGLSVLFYNVVFHLITKYIFDRWPLEETEDRIRRRLLLINSQIVLDLVVLAALVYFTGGLTSPFLFFFVFHMVISSILLSRRNAYALVFFTIIMVSSLFYLEHFHYIQSQPFFSFYPEELAANGMYQLLLLVTFSITMVVTVFFASKMMRSIRQQQMDLTELKNDLSGQRDQLEMKNQELEELDKSKTEFLYRVEHELKAPIGALSSLLSVVTRGGFNLDEEKKKEFLNRAEKRVVVMKELVSDLLSLSKITERRFQLEMEPIRLDELLAEVIEDLSIYAHRKGIGIKTDFKTSLPLVRGDKYALMEISRNLVHNAVKYSFEGDALVSLSHEEGGVVFTVTDRGIGISEEDIENIFTEFYRTSNAKAFEEGTGLGLSLVKRLVEQHGGTINVSSQLNEGTTFTVKLPIQL
ncbi:MAG: hypothetical protein GY950_26505 [bacterium]|nr:hypothetical protein [bacterium]